MVLHEISPQSELHESMKANVKQNILIAEDYIESLPIQIVLYH